MEKYFIVGIILLMVLVLLVVLPAQERSDTADIHTWASDNGHIVSNVERCFFNPGPYFFTKNCRIYKVSLESGRTFWFRFCWWSPDIEEYPK